MQQATADQAFTNAKAAGDVQGMVDALIYRALERNSGSVGATTNACTSITAVNPEIAAVQQHQVSQLFYFLLKIIDTGQLLDVNRIRRRPTLLR